MEVESPGNLWVKRLHQPMSRRDVSIVLFETSVLLAPLQVMPELFELWRRTQEKRALWSSNFPIQRLVFVARSRRSSLSLILTQMDRRPKFWIPLQSFSLLPAALEFLSRLVALDSRPSFRATYVFLHGNGGDGSCALYASFCPADRKCIDIGCIAFEALLL